MTATEILSEIYGDCFDEHFEKFKVESFKAVFKGSWSGHEQRHRIRSFGYAILATADRHSEKGKEFEANGMLRWFCEDIQGRESQVERLRRRIMRRLSEAGTKKNDIVCAGRYERYLSCIPYLVEMGYVKKEEELALDEYHADKGILFDLEQKIGAVV